MNAEEQINKFYEAWEANVSVRKLKDGNYSYKCRKGLWQVSGPKEFAKPEAVHYFRQYYEDGEYDK